MKKTLAYFGVLQVVLALVMVANAQTSNITFTVPTAIVPELVAAFDANFTRQAGELPSNAANDAAFVKRITRDAFWKRLVNQRRLDTSASGTALTTQSDFGN